MPTKIKKHFISVVIITLLASCGRVTIENTQVNNSTSPAQVSETEAVSIVSIAQTSVSNTNYLHECKAINPEKTMGQVPYLGILPGKTKESELESLLGIPDKTSVFEGVTNLVYGDTGLLVEKGVVKYVVVSMAKTSGFTLKQLVLRYGCPDLVFAVNTTEDQVGYTGTRFIYYDIGIEFSFMVYPTNLNDTPSSVSYFSPMDLQEYLEKNGWTIMGTRFGKPVKWTEAVR